MQSINPKPAVRTRDQRPQVKQVLDDAVYVARWLRHLAVELSCAGGLAVPLEALLPRWAGRVQPRHMFDGLRQLLEQGEAQLELGPGGYLLALAPPGAAVPRYVTRGELAVLAAAIGAAQGRGEEVRQLRSGRLL